MSPSEKCRLRQQGTAHGVAIAVSSRVCALISGLAWPGMPHPILSKARQ